MAKQLRNIYFIETNYIAKILRNRMLETYLLFLKKKMNIKDKIYSFPNIQVYKVNPDTEFSILYDINAITFTFGVIF